MPAISTILLKMETNIPKKKFMIDRLGRIWNYVYHGGYIDPVLGLWLYFQIKSREIHVHRMITEVHQHLLIQTTIKPQVAHI